MRGLWRYRMLQERWRAAARLQAAERAVAQFPRIASKRKHNLPYPVIVSLTSYPPRFHTLSATVKSLLDQDVQADRTILWVTPDDYHSLPKEVMGLRAFGLSIETCENYLSFKKLVPALTAYPDHGVVTADDDLYFHDKWLGSILDRYEHEQPAIISARCHLANLGPDGRLLPYRTWLFDTEETADLSDTEILFPTGGAGTLYPPRLLPREVCDSSRFLELCPRADDLWFFWIAEQSRVRHLRISERFPLIPWRGSQDAGLYHDNIEGGGNDQQIANLEADLGLLHAPTRQYAGFDQ